MAALPLAEASTRAFAFSPASNEAVPGTFLLLNGETQTGTVALAAGTAYVWSEATALAAPAAVNDGVLAYDLWFAQYGGQVRIDYGTVAADGTFHQIATKTVIPVKTPRDALASVPLGTPADIGRAQGSITGINGTLAKDEHLAIRLTSPQGNSLYTDETALGAQSASTATVPLPELPAIALTALGLVLVAGVVVLRRR